MKPTAFLFSFFILFTLISCTGHNERNNPEDISYDNSTPEENQNFSDYTYLALGDSYTIGESVDTEECFPVRLTKKLTKNGFLIDPPDIVAQTGWTTDELAAGIENSNLEGNYDLVASDKLHPSGEMYRLWVEDIYPVAKQILEKSN